MANQNLNMKSISFKATLSIFLSTMIVLNIAQVAYAKKEVILDEKKIYLTNLTDINITNDSTKDLESLKKLIDSKRPKAIYLEQWITMEPNNENILKKLQQIAKKNNIKFYLIIGKNVWFGERGLKNTLAALDTYGKYIDGIVLRVEPNKANVWKDDFSIKAQILNLMLDAYSAIHIETKKRNKTFIAEFPFWLSDFKGPNRTFSQDTCMHTDKIIFLIDDPEKLDKLEINWHDVTCTYNIDITKRATNQTEDSVRDIYHKLKEKLTLYSNFNGYIIDSDSTLEEDI